MLIHAANLLLLVLLLVGLPAAASQSLGPWNLSKPESLRWLTLAGLTLAAVLNFLVWLFATGKKNRQRCLRWLAIHLALTLIQWLLLKEVLDFKWLKQALLWLQNRLPGS